MSFYLIDQMAEKQIQEAIDQGQLDNLPGAGKPLVLDDNSMVPEHLRAAYHILRNAGYLPPELEEKKEAVKLAELLTLLRQQEHTDNEPALLAETSERLQRLELKLRIKGFDTSLIRAWYGRKRRPGAQL